MTSNNKNLSLNKTNENNNCCLLASTLVKVTEQFLMTANALQNNASTDNKIEPLLESVMESYERLNVVIRVLKIAYNNDVDNQLLSTAMNASTTAFNTLSNIKDTVVTPFQQQQQQTVITQPYQEEEEGVPMDVVDDNDDEEVETQVIKLEQDTITQDTITQNNITQDNITQETITQKNIAQKTITQKGIAQETITQEAITQEAIAQKDITQKATTQEATTQEATTQEATTQEATTQEATTQEATTQEATTQEATTQEATTQEATTQEATTQEATTQEDTTQEDTIQTTLQKALEAQAILQKATFQQQVSLQQQATLQQQAALQPAPSIQAQPAPHISSVQFLDQFEDTAVSFATQNQMKLKQVWESLFIHALPSERLNWANKHILKRSYDWHTARKIYLKSFPDYEQQKIIVRPTTVKNLPIISITKQSTRITKSEPPSIMNKDNSEKRQMMERQARYAEHLLSLEMKEYDSIYDYNSRFSRYSIAACMNLNDLLLSKRYISSLLPKYRNLINEYLTRQQQVVPNNLDDLMDLCAKIVGSSIEHNNVVTGKSCWKHIGEETITSSQRKRPNNNEFPQDRPLKRYSSSCA